MLISQPLLKDGRLKQNVEIVHRLRSEIAEPKGISVAQVAMNWVLANPYVSTALAGARNPREVEEDAQVVELSRADLAAIDDIMAGAVGRVDVFKPCAWVMEDRGASPTEQRPHA